MTRTQVVLGEGKRFSQIFIIGEAPGSEEDIAGRPFIGKSGRLMRDTLEMLGVPSTSLYISNAVKCHPPKNKTPLIPMIDACHHWLDEEIQYIQPEIIVAMGGTALRSLGFKKLGVEEARRSHNLSYKGIPVIAAYHPAAALRMQRNMGGFVRDMERIAEYLGIKVSQDQVRNYVELPANYIEYFHEIEWVRGCDLALDTEYEEDGTLVCYSFSFVEGYAYTVILDWDNPKDWEPKVDLLIFLISQARKLIFHNAKADIPIIDKVIYPFQISYDKVEDTIIQAYVLRKAPLSLKSLSENELGLKVIRLDEIRSKDQMIADIPHDDLIKYSCQDPDLTLRLYKKFSQELSLA